MNSHRECTPVPLAWQELRRFQAGALGPLTVSATLLHDYELDIVKELDGYDSSSTHHQYPLQTRELVHAATGSPTSEVVRNG